MKNAILLLLILFLPTSLMAQGIGSQATNPKAKPAIYDPARNAAEDIEQAVADAAETGKRVLLEVGGNWCVWCYEMERYFQVNQTRTVIQ